MAGKRSPRPGHTRGSVPYLKLFITEDVVMSAHTAVAGSRNSVTVAFDPLTSASGVAARSIGRQPLFCIG
jgi:hypothetical protein